MSLNYQLDDGVTNHPDRHTTSPSTSPTTTEPDTTTTTNTITIPAQLTVHRDDKIVTLTFHDGTTYTLPVEHKHHSQLQHHIQHLPTQPQPTDTKHDKPHTVDIKPSPTDADKPDKQIPPYGLRAYALKYGGVTNAPRPPTIPVNEGIWAFIASFVAIAVLALIQYNAFAIDLHSTRDTMIIGSFGASAVLLYSAIGSDLSQPRNVIGGHVLSAIVGVAFAQMPTGDNDSLIWLQSALAVSVAITVMNVTRTLHPPAGATALIAVLPSGVQSIGWLYVGLPVASGATILVLIALIFNNIAQHRRYPKYWW